MKGFKTIILGVAIALIAVLGSAEMQAYIALHIPAIGGLIGTAIVVLRAVTTSPILKSK